MGRYKGYLVPMSCVKSGSLLKKLAAREQTTSDDILHSATRPDSKESEEFGPLTSTAELLEALDLAIGSDEKDCGEHRALGTEPAVAQAEVVVSGAAETTVIPKRRRRTKKEIEAADMGKSSYEEPRFVELTKLLPPVPKKGNFEVNTVKRSLYFFS